MSAKQARTLLNKYREGKCSEHEKAIVEQWLFSFNDTETGLSPKSIEVAREEIWKELPVPTNKNKNLTAIKRYAIAATVLLMVSFSAYFLLQRKQAVTLAQHMKTDAAPGSYKATLTLSNGKQIDLSEAKSGILARDKKILIQKATDKTITYTDNSSSGDRALAYNIITTPRGGQWPLILPDGSKVILNAESSIRYPLSFAKNERRVELTGEAYFEVIHNAISPFKVISNGQTVEVLGTHFNINAYSNEPAIITTLLEGSVKVSKDNAAAMINPGQEAVWANHAHQFKIDQVDTEEAVAWKNGVFQFDHSGIEAVMRQAGRWYDLEISYKGAIPQATFSGSLSRNVNASRLLEALEITGVHFNIEGKKIIVRQ